MPDQRGHRGPHPEDLRLFAEDYWPALRAAVADLSWLLSRGYSLNSAIKLTGDRYQLTERQRLAVMRCACSEVSRQRRAQHCVPTASLAGMLLVLDGYNVLTSVEAALGGGVILQARDGCFRDMASLHGTYRKVAETIPALHLIGQHLSKLQVDKCHWLLDSPVSNSGRLKSVILKVASEQHWNWSVELVPNPDAVLSSSDELIATADSEILNHCHRWVNLARDVITTSVPTAHIVDLSDVASHLS